MWRFSFSALQQSRPMCILQTYKEKYEGKPKEEFVNPLRQPKLKEIAIDDVEKVLAAQPPMEDTDMVSFVFYYPHISLQI